jgi:NADPH:quinone reductase-like Zn-dependent oxidoreductase
MKAIWQAKYGTPDILQIREVAKPVPKEDEVLVKIHAASVNAYDWHLLTADIFLVRFMGGGLRTPKHPIPGEDISGKVEAVGPRVTEFKPGDQVYGDISRSGSGGFAEYVTAPELSLAPKPANLSFEQAAAVPMAALTALQGLRDEGRIESGQQVLIQGASGGVGTFAVQIAKAFGAEVTAVCSTRNLDQARSIGADHVVDYTAQDFTNSGKKYDLILAANGYHPLSAYKRALAPRGTYVMAGGTTAQIFQAVLLGRWMSERGGRSMRAVTATPIRKDLLYLTELLESGAVVPVIDRRFAFDETAEALRYLGAGHARGEVVVRMDQVNNSEHSITAEVVPSLA